jgi:RNA polymerase sigma factor (TIGR02999 family)
MSEDLTRLLLDIRTSDPAARERLFDAAYEELRQLARAQRWRHASDSTLQTTALVHEAYVKLFDRTALTDGDRTRFFGIAARAMRQVLVDHYRRSSAAKRGGDAVHVDLEDQQIPVDGNADLLLSMDQALSRLETINARWARVVESRFFGGMTEEEIAEGLGVSVRTVRNDWRKARAWLAKEMRGEEV